MAEQDITIRIAADGIKNGKPLTIAAEVFGVWAAHMIVTVNNTQFTDHWTVTHTPTGLSIGLDASEGVAMAVAYRLSQVCGATTKSGVVNVKGKIKAIQREELQRFEKERRTNG